MALKTTIPTLEIKTTGTDLSLIETLYVTIKQGEFQTIKSSDDIEVDNDVISVSLSQDEAAQLSSGGGANVSIMAVGYDGNVTTVKVAWAKRGSRTSSSGGGGGGSSESDKLWYPNVSQAGVISWSKSESETPPMPVDIKGAPGEQGVPGEDGEDGFSPTIVPNSGNTADIYKLDITTKAESITTPNLKGENGKDGERGEAGDDGFSPLISENPQNNDSTYKLDITTAETSFTTPNLKGPKGDPGEGGSSGVSSFNGRTGAVVPMDGDYTAEMVGAATMEQVNSAIQAAILESWGASY